MKLEPKDLRLLFEAGDLVEAKIMPAPMEEGWILEFTRRNGDRVNLTKWRTGTPKVMKRLDTVKGCLRDIGFKNASWHLAT